jgi:two-component system, NarL family, sensor histidine kinase UhpB
MNKPLKILHLEDVPIDAELVSIELKKGKIQFEALVVDNKKDFINALKEFSPDIILSDHNLPTLNSIDALKLVKEAGLKIPVILVTAAMSEEFAVNVMKGGAVDYILKDRLQRLPTAVTSAMEKFQLENERRKFLEEIIENESLLKETENLAHVGSWESNLLNGKTYWSEETYRIFGYEPMEITPSFENLIKSVHPEDKEYVKRITADILIGMKSRKFNFRIIRKDGSVKHIRSELLIERNPDGLPIKITGFNQDVTETRMAVEELQSSREQLRALAAYLQNIREEERTAIAREIHDELGQVLTSLKMNLTLIGKSISSNESIPNRKEIQEEIDSMKVIIDGSVKRIKKIITELRSEVLDNLGLIPAIEWHIGEFSKTSGIEVSFNNAWGEVELNKDISIAIYRILQEALTNVGRHSKATNVNVKIEKDAESFKIEIQDNGIGIKQEPSKGSKSFGVLGMRERAIILGGDFKIENIEPGTRVTVTIPLEKSN